MLLAQITDLHIDSSDDALLGISSRRRSLTVLSKIKRFGIATVIITGDAATGGGADWLFGALRGLELDYYLCFGNHDDRDELSSHCLHHEEACPYYALDIGGCQALVLDSSAGSIDNAQAAWFKDAMDGPGAAYLFVHHPVLDCGGTYMDRTHPLLGRSLIEQSLRGRDKPVAIFSGHYHNEYQASSDGVRQYVAPSTTTQIEPYGDSLRFDTSFIGFRIIEIGEAAFSTRVVRIGMGDRVDTARDTPAVGVAGFVSGTVGRRPA